MVLETTTLPLSHSPAQAGYGGRWAKKQEAQIKCAKQAGRGARPGGAGFGHWRGKVLKFGRFEAKLYQLWLDGDGQTGLKSPQPRMAMGGLGCILRLTMCLKMILQKIGFIVVWRALVRPDHARYKERNR